MHYSYGNFIAATSLMEFAMLRNYIKIAFRNLVRQKVYSFINVFGLSFGLTCCLLIGLYIRHELSYEDFHKQASHIYRVVEDVTVSGSTISRASVTGAAGPALVSDFPEVIRMVRFTGASMLIAYRDKRFQEDNVFFTDSTVFDIFTFPLLKGNPRTALSAPLSIVLSKETAQRYFGEMDPVGQTLVIDNDNRFTVTGVFENIPSNTHLQFDILLSMSTRGAEWLDGWSWYAYTYIQLAPGSDEISLQKKFLRFVERHTGNKMWEKDRQHGLLLQPLPDIHLHSKRSGEPGTPGSMSKLYLFSFIAIFIVLIACINFVNLTTAQATRRTREIGLRKVVGGTRTQLVTQFLSESVLLSLSAAFLAIGLCDLLLPFFRTLAGIPVTLNALAEPSYLVLYFCSALIIGCLAGSYPAILLSGFRIMNVLKGSFKGSPQGSSLRKVLIVLQFSISMALIAGTITVFSQLRYMEKQDLGYDQHQVLVLYFGDDTEIQRQVEAVKQEILRSPYVDSVAASSHVPGKKPGGVQVVMETESGITQPTDLRLLAADYDFIPFYNLALAAGREFSPLYGDDATGALMLNETAATQLGFADPSEIMGKQLLVNGQKGNIIGVVKDFHYESLHKRIEPLLIRMRARSLSYLSLDIRSETITAALSDLEKRWLAVAPHRPFDFFFLDEHFEQHYRADKQFGQAFSVFATIAIILACLGLFGLTSFTVQQRTKEIGIRKVLGASVAGIVALLSKDFVRLVLAAVIIATPFAWYTMNRWLQDFAYRIDVHWWIFFLAGALVFLIAVFTVSFLSVKAATADPVNSLRNE